MLTAIIDYESGNLHSAEKAFQRMAQDVDGGTVVVTSDAETVARADRIVLPGDGAFPACAAALRGFGGVYDALREAVEVKARPFMGICVGMQLMAELGREYHDTPGLGWIGGDVSRIVPSDASMKIPHMGWNDLHIDQPHPVQPEIPHRPRRRANVFAHLWAHKHKGRLRSIGCHGRSCRDGMRRSSQARPQVQVIAAFDPRTASA